jgi:hypothetical protein
MVGDAPMCEVLNMAGAMRSNFNGCGYWRFNRQHGNYETFVAIPELPVTP